MLMRKAVHVLFGFDNRTLENLKRLDMRTIMIAVLSIVSILIGVAAHGQTPSFSCTISENGHRYTIYATNSSNYELQCTVKCQLTIAGKDDDTPYESPTCIRKIQRNVSNLEICSNYENTLLFSQVTGTSHSCEN